MGRNVRTAFLLQIHKNPHQVNQFIQQLVHTDRADVYIHIDLKYRRELESKILHHPNVFILKESVRCRWGDIGQVDATLLLMKEALDAGKVYDYLCLRSGQDLLVKNGYKEFLAMSNGAVFLATKELPEKQLNLALMKIRWPEFARKRYTSLHPIRIYRCILIQLYHKGIPVFQNLKEWPADFRFFNGSQWFALPEDAARYIISFLEANQWYYSYFRDALCPDEWFFHTLIMNSPYRERVVNDNQFFMKWGETFQERNSPQTLVMDDCDDILQAGQFFGRKFDEQVDKRVIDYFIERVNF